MGVNDQSQSTQALVSPRIGINGGGDGTPGPIERDAIVTVTAPLVNATISCSEPGQRFTVSGTYQLVNLIGPSVSVSFDGHTYDATLTPKSTTAGTFSVAVRAYHSGAQTITATGSGKLNTVTFTGDDTTVGITVNQTRTTPSVAITSPTANSAVGLGESGADVAVTVTTADTAQYGPRKVTALVDNTSFDLAPVSGSTTQFSGTVHFGAMPLGARALAVKCVCVEAPDVAGSASENLTGRDVAPPHPAVTNPPPDGNVLVDPATMNVKIVGTASDAQSGMKGGSATVAVSLSASGPRIAATPAVAGDFSNWSVVVKVPTYGAFTLYVWGTDAAGNTNGTPLASAFTAVSAYVPKTLQDRLSDLEYLLALMRFAREQITTATGPADSATLAATLHQPIDRISVPLSAAAQAGEVSINELRIPVEILRQHIAGHGLSTAPGSAGESRYLVTAYEALLSAAGTSYAELRLARGADTDTRTALAARLGIPLYGLQGGTTRPDQLDALTLDERSITESALETLFGLPATTASLDPLRTLAMPSLTQWRLEALRRQWLAADTGTPAKSYTAIVDPDVITADDVLAHSALGPQVLTLLTQRAGQLTSVSQELTAMRTGRAPTDAFAAMLTFASVPLAELRASDVGGADISAQLASAGLDRAGFDYLVSMSALVATGLVTDVEWADTISVLVGSYRRRQYPTWRTAEAAISLSPDTFSGAGHGPSVSAYRIDAKARADWLSTLSTRSTQLDALLAEADQIVATAEQLSLPILRDALIADVAPSVQGDPGEAITNLYQVDVTVSGALRTTRVGQATATLQSLIALVRSGDNAAIAPYQAWHLTNPIGTFDTGWSWLGTYGGWQAATTTFLFPEAALDPTLLLQTTPGPSQAFINLATVLLTGGDVDATLVDPKVAAYQNDASTWLQGKGQANAQVTYLASRSRDNQKQLAAWSAAVDAQPSADAARVREIFWAVPMLLGQRLQAAGRYQQALDWYWVAYPYNDSGAVSAYDVVNTEATSAPAAPDLTFVQNWTSDLNPFDLVAKRPAPYLRASLLAIATCLVEYADAQFTAETDASIAMARDLYLSARALLKHPRLQPVTPQNPGEAPLPIPQLSTLATRVDAQLAKLRQGRNIAGLPRTQPTSTADLIAAPTPYHFKLLLTRAQQLAQQAGQLEAEYLAALEKYDSKTLQLSDAQHALDLATAQLSVHAAQVQAANDGVAAAQAQKDKATQMVSTYSQAIASPSDRYEQALFGDYSKMRDMQDVIAGADAAIGIAQAASSGLNFWDEMWSFGGAGVAATAQIAGYVTKAAATATLDNIQSQMQANQLRAGIEERKREWQIQLASAQGDVLVASAQLTAATDQVTIATAEQQVAQLQNDQARATLLLLQTQFTNADLYKWMSDTLGGVYRYFLQQATATARLAQAQLAFERAEPARTFIRSDYWQGAGKPTGGNASSTDVRGLTGAEQLAEDLAQLDGYAFSSDSRRLNISQTFALAQLMPVEFLDFRATGQLTFSTPMSWFDQDFPGHYQRLIRQVKLTVVALVPPTRGIRATLSCGGISDVVTATNGTFSTVTLSRDPRTVALTSPLNASGVFELDLQADMLLPFEGIGVATSWQLSLPPAANPFDYSAISDVLLTIEYTAMSDPGYQAQVVAALNANRARSSDCVFSLRRDFPDQWYELNNPPASATQRSTVVTMRDVDFPPNISGLTVANIAVSLQAGQSAANVPVTLSHGGTTATATTDATGSVSSRRGAATWAQGLVGGSPVGDWTLSLGAAANALFDAQAIDDVLLVISWAGQAPLWQA